MDLEIVWLRFTKEEFDEAAPYYETLKKWHEEYTIALHAGNGCKKCRHRRVNAKYKNQIRGLLAENTE